MYEYLIKHKYLSNTDNRIFHSRHGWDDYVLQKNLVYSFRDDTYDAVNRFDENIHAHPHYEFILYLNGGVEFISGEHIIKAPPVSLVWFKPSLMHTVRLVEKSRYTRHIFYLKPEAFDYENCENHFLDFVKTHENTFCLSVAREHQPKALDLLNRLQSILNNAEGPDYLSAYATTALIFRFFNTYSDDRQSPEIQKLPNSIIQIKQYIDENYASIPSVEHIAQQFFYSREYICRLFRKYYNISIAEYLMKYRILESQKMLDAGVSISDACYASGFNNMSTYISSFKKVIGVLPSRYVQREST